MYTYICIYINQYIYSYVYIYIYIYICIHICIFTYVNTHAHIYTYKYVYTHTFIHTYTYACICKIHSHTSNFYAGILLNSETMDVDASRQHHRRTLQGRQGADRNDDIRLFSIWKTGSWHRNEEAAHNLGSCRSAGSFWLPPHFRSCGWVGRSVVLGSFSGLIWNINKSI